MANISRDGRKLYLPSAGAFVDVYDTETLKLIKLHPADEESSQIPVGGADHVLGLRQYGATRRNCLLPAPEEDPSHNLPCR